MNHLVFLFSFLISYIYGALALADFQPVNRPYDVTHYQIRLSLDPFSSPGEFHASVLVKLKVRVRLTQVDLDTENLHIHKVHEGSPQGRALSFKSEKSRLQISLEKVEPKGKALSLFISYTGKINSHHNGFFKVVDPDEPDRGPLFFTHFEPLSARAFFPCNDEPYDKATSEMIVQSPKGVEVVSNGKQISDRKVKIEGKEWHEVTWLQAKPHPTYLVSLALGRFSKVTVSKGSPEVSAWVGQQKTESSHFVVEATERMLRYFEKYLDVKYPWPKYATVGLPTFLWGGMENTSATHMNQERMVLNDPRSEFEKKSIVGLAAHELAHQWFGDYATMHWWDDIWLNEAFASYLGTLATKDFFKSDEPDVELATDTWDFYFREEDGPRSHPIVNQKLSSPDDAFDATAYTKGENVLRMLSYFIGEEKFRNGLKHYLRRFALGNATYVDFFNSMEKVSGKSLSAFRDSWLLHRGYPVITYAGEWDANTLTYHLNLSSQPNHVGDKNAFIFRLPVVFHRKTAPAYSAPLVLTMDKATHVENLRLPSEPEWISVNTGGIVLAKVRMRDRNEPVLSLQALNDPDPVSRVWASYELAQELREGGKASPLVEKTWIQSIETDASPYVRNALLEALQKMKGRWLPERLGGALFALSKRTFQPEFQASDLWSRDPHGWSLFRSVLLATLGKVENKEISQFLTTLLNNSQLPLDEVRSAAFSIALLGDSNGGTALRSALKVHEKRGYRYRYWILYAFGAYENARAAEEIREIASRYGEDLLGRIGWVIRDNQTLKNSVEWTTFLKDFILSNQRFGDEVKTRILGTIEEVKNSHVHDLLKSIIAETSSDRIREASKKILEKNFGLKG